MPNKLILLNAIREKKEEEKCIHDWAMGVRMRVDEMYLLFVDSQLDGFISEFRWEIGQIPI